MKIELKDNNNSGVCMNSGVELIEGSQVGGDIEHALPMFTHCHLSRH